MNEEKKAIKMFQDYIKRKRDKRTIYNTEDIIFDNINIILEKQQKELEREKQYSDFYEDLCKKQQKEIEELKNNKNICVTTRQYGKIYLVTKDYISKDKIREKIQEIDGQGTFDAKIILQKLLEENK